MSQFTLEEALLFIQTPKRYLCKVKHNLYLPEGINLNPTQLHALFLIRDIGPVSLHILGEHAGIIKGSLTQVIDVLVERDLIERRRDENDRRSVLVNISEKGKVVTSKMDDNLVNHFETLFSSLDDDEKQALIDSIKKMDEILNNIEEREYERK